MITNLKFQCMRKPLRGYNAIRNKWPRTKSSSSLGSQPHCFLPASVTCLSLYTHRLIGKASFLMIVVQSEPHFTTQKHLFKEIDLNIVIFSFLISLYWIPFQKTIGKKNRSEIAAWSFISKRYWKIPLSEMISG